MQVLVTGASGFIGPRLVQALQAQGHQVACLVRRTSATEQLSALGAQLVQGDVTDPESLPPALAKADQVYHLAGRTHARNLGQFLQVNEQGTANLLASCAKRETPPVVLLASSLAAAGPSAPGIPQREETLPQPISNYGRSKLASELAARRWAGEVPLSIVRPPVVFGPGDHDGLNLFKALRLTRLHPVPQRKGLPLSLVYVDDLAQAMLLAVEKGQRCQSWDDARPHDPSGLYYAADPEVTSWAEAGRMAAAALGIKVLVLRLRKYPFLIPALVGDLVGRITGRPTLFGMDKLREASASGWVCDASKAQAELGFCTPEPLAERYRQTADWYRQAGWLPRG